MPVTIDGYFQFTATGNVVWSDVAPDLGKWLLVLHGVGGGTLADMRGDPGGFPQGSWQKLAEVDAGDGLPKWRLWAVKATTTYPAPINIQVFGPATTDVHSHLYYLSSLWGRDDAFEVFDAWATANAAAATAQVAPGVYTPDDSGLLIGAWLAGPGGAINYTMPGGMSARAELDGSAGSTSRTAEQSISAHGSTGQRTATASAARSWAALSVAIRQAATGSITFPGQPIQTRVELAPGANPSLDPSAWADNWVQVTGGGDTYAPVSITRGRSDETSTASPSSCSLSLKNIAGKYTRLNPLSPFYGGLSKNTPLRVWANAGAGWERRFAGFVSEWPPRQQGGSTDERMPIQANGVTRRLSQGRVLRSALFRALSDPSVPWRAYWPLEDGENAKRAATGIPGGQPMWIVGNPQFGAEGPPGATGAVSLDVSGGAYLTGAVLGQPAGIGWVVNFWFTLPAGFDPTQQQSVAIQWSCPQGSTWKTYLLHASNVNHPGRLLLQRWDDNGNFDTVNYPADLAILESDTDLRGKGPTLITLAGAESSQTGEEAPLVQIYINGAQEFGVNTSIGDVLGPIASVRITYAEVVDAAQGTVSHLGVTDWPGANAIDPEIRLISYAPGLGYSKGGDRLISRAAGQGLLRYEGETAGERMVRLSAEEGVPFIYLGDPADSAAMGPQTAQTYPALMRECEAADGGVLFEGTDGRWRYRPRSARYNRTPSITVDPSGLAPPLEPTDDDQRTRNDVEVTRPSGGSARVTDQAHIDVVGRYDDSVSLALEGDEQLPDQAGWAVHLGTNDDLRFPSISPNLNGQPSLIADWVASDVGDVIAITDPPRDLPPDTIKNFIEGYTETIDTVSWTAVANCSPAKPYDVAVLGEGHLDTDGSVLAASITSTATTLQVQPPGRVYEDFEDATLNVTITSGGNAAWARSTTKAHTGSWSLRSGAILDNQTSVANIAIPAGAKNVGLWWYVSSEYAFDFLTISAGPHVFMRASGEQGWTYLQVDLPEDATTLTFTYAKDPGTVGGTDAAWVDDITFGVAPVWTTDAADMPIPVTIGGEVMTVTAISGTAAPQTFTVTRSVNGVVKSHGAGEAVHVADPMILSL